MVKATCDFIYRINNDGRYHQDGKETFIKKGQEVPSGIVPRIAYGNPEYLDGALDKTKRKVMVDKALGVTNNLIKEKKIVKKEPRYTKVELKALNKAEQLEALAKFGISASEIRVKYRLESQRVDKLYKLYMEEL